VISILLETKITIVDMKVYVYSKFRKNKIWKKVKSPISMRNGRFYTSKCSFKKWGCCRCTPPRSPGPYYMQGPLKNKLKMHVAKS
jgi:hypothetical protein